MDGELAQYACDECRTRKVSCSRNYPDCQRCVSEGHACYYSRSGVIRRNRKKKETAKASRKSDTAIHRLPQERAVEDDQSTHERLRRLTGRDHAALRVLAPLFDEYFAAWQDASAFNQLREAAAKTYYLLNEHASRTWTAMLFTVLRKRRLPIASAFDEVREHLAAGNIHRVKDQSWLVMFYSVALSSRSEDATHPKDTKAKLKSNLWLAFNDVRLFIEPSLLNVQALIVLATQVDEYMTPSVCWMLVSKACTMIQTLGQIRRSHESSDQQKSYRILFWQLNYLDKTLALSLMKPPTIHTEATKAVPMPTLDQLAAAHHEPNESRVFDAHYTHQMYLLSEIMGEASRGLSTQARQGFDHELVSSNMDQLDKWYRKATEVLGAAASTEKPLLTADGQDSIEQGLINIRFLYYHMQILLTRGCKSRTLDGREPAENLLRRLKSIRLDQRSPSDLHIWQLLFCPFAAFQSLVGHVLMTSKMGACYDQNEQSLQVMELLPTFLEDLGKHTRNPLVRRLEVLACRFYAHAKAVFYSEELECARDDAHRDSQRSTTLAGSQRSGTDHDMGTQGFASVDSELDGYDMDWEPNLDDLLTWWTNDALIDGTFDWFGTVPTGFEESQPST
ncbi:hypothetical protein M409DRAFT_26761 [Zasmidium cellare ATCC 36951]|uniref:Zn(2)-C6 fungal-type domain-containing protein n=1 Tax=Zasmidium cellare ATCC 36951 TaxID=1080233 RepID=A0A6A6CB76_ZASCE|nr:uncharacterized protein M409DRAFT_26761 [Zasmidium cellare ATCC 36951]KAF2162909.1 hypothetical protein M409DRAFT_26761 [Zasmidium cellare ATCC 36951]